MSKLTRRALLGSAGILVLGGVAYGGSRVACKFVPRNHPDFFSLLDIVPDGPAVRRIGYAALDVEGFPSNLQGLSDALSSRPLFVEALATDCPVTRRTLVQDQCAEDFAAQRTVIVDGWVLSETEARLCAARMLRGSLA